VQKLFLYSANQFDFFNHYFLFYPIPLFLSGAGGASGAELSKPACILDYSRPTFSESSLEIVGRAPLNGAFVGFSTLFHALHFGILRHSEGENEARKNPCCPIPQLGNEL
jgi:hypothetical protein